MREIWSNLFDLMRKWNGKYLTWRPYLTVTWTNDVRRRNGNSVEQRASEAEGALQLREVRGGATRLPSAKEYVRKARRVDRCIIGYSAIFVSRIQQLSSTARVSYRLIQLWIQLKWTQVTQVEKNEMNERLSIDKIYSVKDKIKRKVKFRSY